MVQTDNVRGCAAQQYVYRLPEGRHRRITQILPLLGSAWLYSAQSLSIHAAAATTHPIRVKEGIITEAWSV
jgi:hypothetical protein